MLDAVIDPRVKTGLSPYRVVLREFVHLAGPPAVGLAVMVLAVVSLLLRNHRLALVVLVGTALTGLATALLQPLIGRTLNGAAAALPSGHTAGITAAATAAALVVLSVANTRTRAAGLLAAAGVFAIGSTMAVALVANDLHYFTDTLAGFCMAASIVLGTAIGVDLVCDRLQAGGLQA